MLGYPGCAKFMLIAFQNNNLNKYPLHTHIVNDSWISTGLLYSSLFFMQLQAVVSSDNRQYAET